MFIDRRLRELGGKKSFVEYFDFVGGTSTGGILALALATGTSLDHLNDPPPSSVRRCSSAAAEKDDHLSELFSSRPLSNTCKLLCTYYTSTRTYCTCTNTCNAYSNTTYIHILVS